VVLHQSGKPLARGSLRLHAHPLRSLRLSLSYLPFGDQSEVTSEATEDVRNGYGPEIVGDAR